MATTEHDRHRLYQRLNELIGSDEADTLMELLPPTGWADVATKHDFAHHAEITNARFDRLEDAIRTNAQIFDSRISAEIGDIRADLRTEISGVRADLRTEISGVRTEIADLRTELHRTLRMHTLVTVGVLGTLISVVGALTGGG